MALLLIGVNYQALAGGLPSPPPPFRDPPGGQTLAARIRSAVPEENSEIHGRLQTKCGSKKTETRVVCQVALAEGTWQTIYQSEATATGGAERLVITHRTNGPNQYLYARAPARDAPLPAPQATADLDAPFAGSDFSLGELGLEFLHWPGQCRMANEQRLGQACFVLESTNSPTGATVLVKSWIDEKNLGLLHADAYDSAGGLVKEFSLDSASFKKDSHGHWQLKEMGIDNKKKHSHTDLKFDTPADP